jgi:hypothetical protein
MIFWTASARKAALVAVAVVATWPVVAVHRVQDLALACEAGLHGGGGAVEHDHVAARVGQCCSCIDDARDQVGEGNVAGAGHAQAGDVNLHAFRRVVAHLRLGQPVGTRDDQADAGTRLLGCFDHWAIRSL